MKRTNDVLPPLLMRSESQMVARNRAAFCEAAREPCLTSGCCAMQACHSARSSHLGKKNSKGGVWGSGRVKPNRSPSGHRFSSGHAATSSFSKDLYLCICDTFRARAANGTGLFSAR
eukprot:scaffold55714_cov57-Phaeocystis_antarctica.AAC.1